MPETVPTAAPAPHPVGVKSPETRAVPEDFIRGNENAPVPENVEVNEPTLKDRFPSGAVNAFHLLVLTSVLHPKAWVVVLKVNALVPAEHEPKTESKVVWLGAAAPPVLLANSVKAAALLNVKLNAGVVVAVATEVVNSGERVPALKEVTGCVQVGAASEFRVDA